jgi:hypothetical protein
MNLIELFTETEWGLDVTIENNAEIDNSNFIDIVKIVLNKCKEINKKKILVDFASFEQKVSPMKIYEAVKVSQEIVGPGLKLAFVAPHLIKNKDLKFVENVGFNRAVFIQYFYDKATAIEWLIN